MKFDWRAFAGNYASGIAADIRERREDAEDFADEQEELARANIPKVQRKRMLANQAAQLGHRARALGATDAQIQNALSSGVEGINEFYQKLEAAASSKGVKTLGKADIDAIVNMPNIPDVDFKFADGEYQDFVEKTYGVGTPEVTTPEKEYTNIQKLFGFDAKDRAKRRLAETQMFEGMTVAEINAAARSAEYESLFPEATMTFTDVKFFGAKDLRQFTRDLEKDMASSIKGDLAEAVVTDAGLAASAAYNKEQEDAGKTPSITEQQKRVAEAEKNALDLLQTEAGIRTIEDYVDMYYNADILNNEAFRRMVVEVAGEEYLEKLLKENDIEVEKDFGEETEDIPFSEITGFTGDAEADEEFRKKQEVQENQKQQPSTQEDQTQEDSQTETSDTKAKKEALLTKTFPKRSDQRGLAAKGIWDRKYEGKVDEQGKAIIAPPRPADGGEKTKEIDVRVGLLGSRTGKKKKVTEAEYWDTTYGDTHDPVTGLPIGLEG